uniref:Uncharacterized protein n=1 Tax=Glossina pallidipes TaxID=7398 RepID=A0A1A9Z8L5_GLOPL
MLEILYLIIACNLHCSTSRITFKTVSIGTIDSFGENTVLHTKFSALTATTCCKLPIIAFAPTTATTRKSAIGNTARRCIILYCIMLQSVFGAFSDIILASLYLNSRYFRKEEDSECICTK